MDTGITEPRIRVNRSAALVLSNAWQDIDFNGTSAQNANTFGKDTISGKPMVWYDQSTKLFRFYNLYDKNYIFRMDPATTATLLTTRATLQYRLVVPNGVSAGVDFYIPFSDDGGYGDISEVTIISTTMLHKSVILPIFVENKIKTNGFKVQMKLSNSLITLGVCTLNSVSVLIY